MVKTYASCKVFVYVLIYSHQHSLFRHLHTEIFISINFISCDVQTGHSKTLKYSEQHIRDYLSGTNVRVWICSEHDAVFNFSCIALCNLTKSFTLFFISLLSQELGSESFNQSTCTLYASEIPLFKVFIKACKLTGEILLHWSFFSQRTYLGGSFRIRYYFK